MEHHQHITIATMEELPYRWREERGGGERSDLIKCY